MKIEPIVPKVILPQWMSDKQITNNIGVWCVAKVMYIEALPPRLVAFSRGFK